MNYIKNWDPNNKIFWNKIGNKVANRNLFCSIFSLMLSFSVWVIWSSVTVKLNLIGFNFTTGQLFNLVSLSGLSGATLRIFYSFFIPIFGGRNWTVISTLTLLIPTIGIGYLVQNLNSSYFMLCLFSILCGFGGGNFSSSMSNISFFYPKYKQGFALGLNAGFGNLGVSLLQFITPLVISISFFECIFGGSQIVNINGNEQQIWLQNAACIFIFPVLLSSILAYFFMDNLNIPNFSFFDQMNILKNKHTYLLTLLYIMSFGSFIGYSTVFPLLISSQFPNVEPLNYAFIGPMIGALVRPLGGLISDKVNSGSIVTFVDLIFIVLGVIFIIFFISDSNKNFICFFIVFIFLFLCTGIANGSVFKMVPMIFSPRDSALVLGFSSAIAAYGSFFIPKIFSLSIKYTGNINLSLYFFIIYYLLCMFITWWYYIRK